MGASAAQGATGYSASSWISYEERLHARLADAGGGAFEEDFAQQLLTHANSLRAAEGLQPYAWDEALSACARAHAADMVSRRYFAHESPEGFRHPQRASLLMRERCGDTAENLAWRDDPWGGSTPRLFETLWENSPGHRKNLLRPGYKSAGYGVVRVGDAVYAAGLYADIPIRLAQPVPLRMKLGSNLSTALDGASPNIERMAYTRPFQDPAWSALPSETVPLIEPGIWQLRPMRPIAAHTFDVLTGPLFIVS